MQRSLQRRPWVAAALLLLLVGGCIDLSYPRGFAVSSDAGAGNLDTTADRPADTTADTTAEPDGQSGDDPVGNGGACSHGGQCATGFCVEGVCCASECGAACYSCKVSGRAGSCVPVPAGQDPGDDCTRAEPASCQDDGLCDGNGACRRYAEASECTPASCTGSTERAASTCDGNGVCRPGTSRSCAPGVCQGGSCGTACTAHEQCLTGFFCEANLCVPKRALGVTCALGSECASGACADGVCCASACTEACHACNLAGTSGTCVPAAAGTDPHDDCPTAAASSCGTSGQCNGHGGCLLHQAGTQCAASSCSGISETPARTCNGLGTCVATSARGCAPYVCGANACRTTCSGAGDCQAGHTCSAASCVATSPDAGGGGGGDLVLDNFSDSNLRGNTLGGVVTWDNANVSLVNGEQRFVWNGASVYHDLIETFRNNWCEYNLTGYRKLRFRMRSSASGKRVMIHLGLGNGSCGVSPARLLTTLTLGTSMTSYELDISGLTRDKVRTVEFTPSVTDGTEYFVDDIILVP